MALKGDRYIEMTDISHFMNEAAEVGGCVSYSTSGSGAALDQSANLVTYAASSSGAVPVGILLDPMVNYNLTRQHLNWHKLEKQVGDKVPVVTRGWVVTNMLVPGTSPTAGNTAYLGASGLLTPTFGSAVTSTVGRFESKKNEDGYVKVWVNLP